ncbi:MAG: type II toxin-antitoxin system PemK/MazF family toxin [Candidatus Pacebacteria bacterium]|nr:type II toxin-antitoxin system PemK/MazF family toxin [Candidatus Paceibacterota bacterium]
MIKDKNTKKDFDLWNSRKKQVHNFGKNTFYKQREIWWCDLGVNIGFEQDGGKNNRRPVLVLKGFSREVCLVVPLTTSHKKENKYYFKIGKIGKQKASVVISQVRLIDTKRFISRIEIMHKKTFEEIRKAIKNLI